MYDFNTNSCPKTIHLAPGTYVFENWCGQPIGASSVTIDGKNDTGEVIIESKDDSSTAYGITISGHSIHYYRNITFKSKRPSTYRLVNVTQSSIVTFTNCTFYHPLNCSTNNNIFVGADISSYINFAAGTTTFALEEKATIPSGFKYAILMTAYTNSFITVSGSSIFSFKNFEQLNDKKSYVCSSQEAAYVIFNGKISYTGTYNSGMVGRWTNSTFPIHGVVAVNSTQISPNAKVTEILTPAATVSSIATVKAVSNEEPNYEEIELAKHYAELDAEYKKVGILK